MRSQPISLSRFHQWGHPVKIYVHENRHSQEMALKNSAECRLKPMSSYRPGGQDGMRAVRGMNTILNAGPS